MRLCWSIGHVLLSVLNMLCLCSLQLGGLCSRGRGIPVKPGCLYLAVRCDVLLPVPCVYTGRCRRLP